MTKTTVKKHPRRGTKGVKRHSRDIGTPEKTVPHNTDEKGMITLEEVNRFLKESAKHKEKQNKRYKKEIENYKKQLKQQNDLLKEAKAGYKETLDKQNTEIRAIKMSWKPSLDSEKERVNKAKKDTAETKKRIKQMKAMVTD